MSAARAIGISRMSDNDRAVLVSFDRPLTDGELRSLHAFLRRAEFPFNELSAAEAERLALLVEEMGESLQAVGKVLRHGYESQHPLDGEDGPTNRQTLERELGDVRHSMVRLCESGDLSKAQIHLHADHKAAKVVAYLHHQDGDEGTNRTTNRTTSGAIGQP